MTMTKQDNKKRRQHKTRTRIQGKKQIPRLSIFRSNRSLYAQIIDDARNVTIIGIHSRDIDAKSRMEQAEKLGEAIAQKAQEKKVSAVRFDRGAYKYHGLVKAFAEGARKGGLNF